MNKMDDMTWQSLVIEVNEYLAADDQLDASLRQVVELNLQVGTNNPTERDAATAALKALLKGRDGTPFRRGQKSSVPAAVRVAIDRIAGVVEEGALAYYNHDAVIAAVSFQHARSGGGLYESGEDYAIAQAKRVKTALGKKYKEGAWDGSLESLLSAEDVADSGDME